MVGSRGVERNQYLSDIFFFIKIENQFQSFADVHNIHYCGVDTAVWYKTTKP